MDRNISKTELSELITRKGESMRNTFPGYFPPTSKEVNRLWENCIFTLDTNILLNLYRYSDATRNEFIKILNEIKDRLWLPHRAAQEYFENRLIVISQQEKAYDDTIKTIRTLQEDLSNARQHPFISDKLMRKLTPMLKEVVEELTSTKATHVTRTSSDEIQKAIGDLFNGRVGPTYSDEQLEAVGKEGEYRYTRKIPPGYKDDGKEEGTSSVATNYRKYGDLIVWRQIIDHATEAKKGVIFVNDDKKEDWWLIFRGKTLGPRPELIQEFLGKTGQGFYMYQADRFLKYAAEHLKQKITPESMDEIRDLRKSDIYRQTLTSRLRERQLILREHEMKLRTEGDYMLKRIEETRARMAYLRGRRDSLQHGQAVYQEKLDASDGKDHESLDRILEYQANVTSLEKEIMQTQEEIKAVERQYEMNLKNLAELNMAIKKQYAIERE